LGTILAVGLALAIVAVFALLGWHILRGGVFEMRTMGAIVLRAAVWIGIAAYLRRLPAKPRTADQKLPPSLYQMISPRLLEKEHCRRIVSIGNGPVQRLWVDLFCARQRGMIAE
jgi:hypothetical protein